MSLVRDAVLVLTQPNDPTASLVVDKLLEDERPVVRMDSAEFPSRAQLSARWTGGTPELVLSTDSADVDLSSLRSIWYRRPSEFEFVEGMTPETAAFARAEARQAFTGALLASPATWMNRPDADSRAGMKLLQLTTAADLGLRIPETLVTNDPADAEGFLEATNGAVIYKRLSQMLLYTHDGRLTAFQTEKVDDAARGRLAQVSVTPCLFQGYVEKAYELRVTVVGSRVFAARVDSQSSHEGAVDWRMDLDLPWVSYELPGEVSVRLVKLVAGFGLRFGAIDLIRTPDGEYVFLEINPSGQWAWFDDDIRLPIRDAIIDELLSPGRHPSLV